MAARRLLPHPGFASAGTTLRGFPPLPDTWGTHAGSAGRSCRDQRRTHRGVLGMWLHRTGPWAEHWGCPAPRPLLSQLPRAGGGEQNAGVPLSLPGTGESGFIWPAVAERLGSQVPGGSSRPGSPCQPRGGGLAAPGIGWQPLRPLPAAQLPDGPWPGLRPASQAGGRSRPPGPPRGCGAGIQGLGFSRAAWPPQQGQRGCWRGSPSLGRLSQPSETHKGRRGPPHWAPEPGSPSLLGKEGLSYGARRTGPNDLEGSTCRGFWAPPCSHTGYSVSQQAFTEHLLGAACSSSPFSRSTCFRPLPAPGPQASRSLAVPPKAPPQPQGHHVRPTLQYVHCPGCVLVPVPASPSGVPSLHSPAS